MISKEEARIQSTIYVGLNDADTGEQRFNNEKYIAILKHVCDNYKVAFSTYQISGGLFHEDGRYTDENTLIVVLIGVSDDIVMEIARDLCSFFHQGSVMVTKAPCSVCFVQEKIDLLP